MEAQTLLRSAAMRFMASPLSRSAAHAAGAARRLISRQPPTIEYFHQADDPYSHLALQRLRCISRRYVVRLRPHLVSAPAPEFLGAPDLYRAWALRDVRDIAAPLDLKFPTQLAPITPPRMQAFSQKFAALLVNEDFPSKALALSEALWSGEPLGDEPGLSRSATEARIGEADALRTRLGHYASAMFYFEGEWYWGVDRLRHLESRLRDMNLCHEAVSPLCSRDPRTKSATGVDASGVTLEFFPSLRSPYTAISYVRVMDLVKRSNVNLKLRPVMPMMMRGVPAPRAKGRYILSDAKREAEAADVPFGRIVDPFGDPVKLAFSLFPWARQKGKGVEYLGAYLGAAFAKGVDITGEKGLQRVVESVGLSWDEGRKFLGMDGWEAELEANVNDMLADGLWGVPSFKVSGGSKAEPYSTWGQDRLWRVETEIASRAG